MAISLQKGQGNTIRDEKLIIGLGWSNVAYEPDGEQFDIDASVFMLGEDKKILSDRHLIFYNNLKSPDESIIHTGDNIIGEDDNEQILIDLSKIAKEVNEISIVVTIYDAVARNQNFGNISNSYIRIVDLHTNQMILKYELEEDFSSETAVEFGKIQKQNGEWKFQAVGIGAKEGLEGFLNKYN